MAAELGFEPRQTESESVIIYVVSDILNANTTFLRHSNK